MTTPGTTTERADQIKGTVADQSGQVAATAKEQVQGVASEATDRARDLAGEARTQVRQQTDQQRERLAGTLHQLGDELRSMSERSESSGVATEVARQAADRVHGLGSYVEQNQPGDLLNEVRAFARRRPGTFLLGALAAGVVAGRMTRGVKAATSGPSGSAGTYDGGTYAGGTYAGGTYTGGTYTEGGTYPSASGYATPPPTHPVTPGSTGTVAGATGTTSAAGTGPGYGDPEVIAVEVEPEDPRRTRGDLP
jgi:uncharacterized protein YjbJ (UPF0337 family)